jgi:uncharacterized membrane-anchored protein YitT (DUF2179 family)
MQKKLFIILAVVPFILALILHQFLGIILMSHYFMVSFVFLTLYFSRKKWILLLLPLFIARLVFLYADKGMDFKAASVYANNVRNEKTSLISPEFGGMTKHYFGDYPSGKNDILYLSCPGKLETSGEQDIYECYLNKHYRLVDKKMFGDLELMRFMFMREKKI